MAKIYDFKALTNTEFPKKRNFLMKLTRKKRKTGHFGESNLFLTIFFTNFAE